MGSQMVSIDSGFDRFLGYFEIVGRELSELRDVCRDSSKPNETGRREHVRRIRRLFIRFFFFVKSFPIRSWMCFIHYR